MRAHLLGITAWLVFGVGAGAQFDLSPPGGSTKTHKLKSPDGKVIEAEIIMVNDDQVKIRKGGRDLNVPLGKFSAETQAYLKKWGEDNVSYSFAFKRTPRQLSSGGNRATYGYEVTLESRVGMTIKDLTIKYQIYNTINEMRKGSKKVSVLLTRDDLKFNTVAGSRTLDRRLEPWVQSRSVGRSGKIGNHLGGIWVKVYDSGGRMVFEEQNLVSGVSAGSWRH